MFPAVPDIQEAEKMKADKYRIKEGKKTDIRKLPTNSKEDDVEKEDIIAKY